MKVLLIVLMATFSLSFSISFVSSGHEEIRQEVADAFEVETSDVTLTSPNLVYVDEGLSTSTGIASFTSCGTNCTNVVIVFNQMTLDFIVEDVIQGF